MHEINTVGSVGLWLVQVHEIVFDRFILISLKIAYNAKAQTPWYHAQHSSFHPDLHKMSNSTCIYNEPRMPYL